MPFNTEHIRRFLPLRSKDFMVLVVLQAGPRHGYALAQAISERSRGHVKARPGDLYRVLYRLSNQGLVAADEPDGPSARRRTRYHLTELGSEVVRAEAGRLVELGNEVLAHGKAVEAP